MSSTLQRPLTRLLIVAGLAAAAIAAPAQARHDDDRGDRRGRQEQPRDERRGGERQERQRREDRGESRSDRRGGEQGSGARLSRQEAARRAQSQYGGRVLSVDPAGDGYRVKLLDDGTVRIINVD